MIPMMQQQLDEFRCTVWNSHRIRAQKDTFMADGVPNHIFEFPERYGMEKQGKDTYGRSQIRCQVKMPTNNNN